jgi:hypothetical protein
MPEYDPDIRAAFAHLNFAPPVEVTREVDAGDAGGTRTEVVDRITTEEAELWARQVKIMNTYAQAAILNKEAKGRALLIGPELTASTGLGGRSAAGPRKVRTS